MKELNNGNEESNEKTEKVEKDDEKETSEKVDYDQLLSSAGEFGWYQVLLTFATCPFYVFGGFSYFSQMFMTEASPNHWCWIPELANLTALERRTLAIPNDINARFGYSQCTAYVANWTEVLATGGNHSAWKIDSCQNGWEFNKSEIPYPTITSELGWVCDKGSYKASAQSAYFVGSLIGGLFFGWVADRYGRIPTAVYSNLIGAVAGVASIFVKNFFQFAVCRFIMGISYDSCMGMGIILLLEYVAPKYRALCANGPMGLFFTLGVGVIPWIALACGYWKTISLATSLPMALAILTPFILPESPRWLLSMGRVDETIEKVKTIARMNKKEIPPKLIEEFRISVYNEVQEQGSIIDLLKIPPLRTMFFCACMCYTSNMIVFDAMVRTLGTLNFDFFVSFTLVSCTEFPALMINSFVLDCTGRKWMHIVALSFSGTLSVMSAFVGSGWGPLVCAILSRFAINMSATACQQWSLELLPTPVRGTGNSIIHTCGFVGTMISPFIAYLSEWTIWLPMLVIGAIAYLGAAISLKLPETTRKEMPQTFDDAQRLIKESKMIEFPWMRKDNVDEGHTNVSFDLNEM